MASKPTTWSVKGIEEDVRDIARAAAERDQQNIGSWIDYAIRVQGGQRPREPDTEASPGKGASTESAQTVPEPAASGLTDQDVLAIIDRELSASTSRLDHALRPMGLALLDLAERMVAVERERSARVRLGGSADSEYPETPAPGELVDDDFGPESLPDSAEPAFDKPDEPDSFMPDPAPLSAPPDLPDAPPPPSHDLAPDLDGLDVPMLPIEQSDRAREIDRRLRALAGEVDAVDATDRDPPPPTGDLGPTEFDIDPPVPDFQPAPDLELPTAFRGLQNSAFDSNPGAMAADAAQDRRRLRRRRIRRAFLGTTGLVAVIAAGLYVFAAELGLGQHRQALDSRLRPAIHDMAQETVEFRDDVAARLAPMMEQARTALFGPGHSEAPEPEQMPDGTPEEGSPADLAQPDSPVSEEMPGPQSNNGQDTDRLPSAGVDQMPQTAAAAPDVPASEPAPASDIAPAPDLADSPVPVPDAVPVPEVSDAPPPAPILPAPAPRVTEPADMTASVPPDGGLPGAERQSLEQRADAGDAKAQHDLALAFLTGAAGTENPGRAAELLREAAIQGLPGAQYNLAVLYETGQGVRQDDVRALLWYHSAAEQGHPNAQYNLGVMYAEGRGIPLNFEEAARWFRAAAKQGMARAHYNLAVMTDQGLGVPQDKEKALELFRSAADAGDQRAIEMLSGAGSTPAESGSALNGTAGMQLSADAPAAMVAAVQEELTRLGLYSGRIDGLMGPKTRAAIRDFQRIAGAGENGEASETLLEQLKAATP
ncbi:peptidoglycan-binding protein [Nisaea sp.]|uniref:peptidoglycan-binding protein n=1 Tax=Nisaea sp. TaxID=2024842 RepID=UPI0032F06B6A